MLGVVPAGAYQENLMPFQCEGGRFLMRIYPPHYPFDTSTRPNKHQRARQSAPQHISMAHGTGNALITKQLISLRHLDTHLCPPAVANSSQIGPDELLHSTYNT